eukprot:1196315-Prorocentrum_minimum.AAC.2
MLTKSSYVLDSGNIQGVFRERTCREHSATTEEWAPRVHEQVRKGIITAALFVSVDECGRWYFHSTENEGVVMPRRRIMAYDVPARVKPPPEAVKPPSYPAKSPPDEAVNPLSYPAGFDHQETFGEHSSDGPSA